MKIQLQKPIVALQPAHKIEPILQADFDSFCQQKIALQKKLAAALQTGETEEHLKNLLIHFLQQTHFQKTGYINTKSYKGQHGADLVIYSDKPSNSQVNVLIEIKRPDNQAEMITKNNIAAKAFYETVLYYLQEKVANQNHELKHILITNLVDFFLFDTTEFNRLFTQHTKLIKHFKGWQSGQLDIHSTKEMYAIIEKIVQESNATIQATHFTFTPTSDKTPFIHLFKLLSPKHLFKQNTLNDTNQLNTAFYNELLYIIGIEEVKKKGTKVIARCKKPQEASLLEITIAKLTAEDLLKNIPNITQYGENKQEQLFHVALTLCLTWINRILFLKLLEAQLIRYHQSTQPYAFLDTKVVKDFNELNTLFFEVLALKPANRIDCLQKQFHFIPYLNSSLFETTDLEKQTLRIANLRNHCLLPTFKQTVLKNNKGKKLINKYLPTLSYLFQFLNAYDFSQTVGDNIIQKQQKDLINSAVLGLIFEKINGYQHGAVFTPSFITMYMCKVSLEKAVIQKFNDAYKWKVKTLQQLGNKIYNEDIELLEANKVFNELKICDPAVGSGHFLVSALNELLRLKSSLKILCDKTGRRIRDWNIDIINDALHIEAKDGKAFEYLVKTKVNGHPYIDEEIQRVQQTLFQEKRYLMEHCLFGVDINANSVQICRLRLWIELLKNAYYTPKSNFKDLETLPNIDINIKCGNSLISRFALDEKLTKAFKNTKWNFNTYLTAVHAYKKETNSTNKQELRTLIKTIKAQFKTSISQQDKDLVQLKKLESELFLKENPSLFGFATEAEKNASKKEKERLQKEIKTLQNTVADKKSGKLYQQAFEWRFEFPEILHHKTIDFQGFDLVIGNPPYGISLAPITKKFLTEKYVAFKGNYDVYTAFSELAFAICKPTGFWSFIMPSSWQSGERYITLRNLLKDKGQLLYALTLPYDVFKNAYVDTGIYIIKNKVIKNYQSNVYAFQKRAKNTTITTLPYQKLASQLWQNHQQLVISFAPTFYTLHKKLFQNSQTIGQISQSTRGILANQESLSIDFQKGYKKLFIGKLTRYQYTPNFTWVKYDQNLKEKPKDENIFEGKRILVRRLINRQFRLMATYVTKSFINKKDLYIFKINNTQFHPLYVLAILNSKLISFFKTKGSTTATKDDFSQITLTELRAIPIKQISLTEQQIFVEKTKLLLDNKGNEKVSEQLETEVDELVYKLYNLTKEEISIIEGK